MHVLILGDRRPQNDADLAYPLLEQAGTRFTYVYRGKPWPIAGGIELDESDVLVQLRRLIRERGIDVLFLRADWFDACFRRYGRLVLEANLGVRKILGYHCHTCVLNDQERACFNAADGFVLINQRSREHFDNAYGLRGRPTLLMPSLYLPSMQWYDRVTPLPKLSQIDGVPRLAVPSAVLRKAGPRPQQADPVVPAIHYERDRYDYLSLLPALRDAKVQTHVFGTPVVYPSGDASGVARCYQQLADDGHIHYEGRVDEADFARVLTRYDAAILTGFLPRSVVPPFDVMNYQLRLNPVLAAGLPVLIAAGTADACADEVGDAAIVFDDITGIPRILTDRARLDVARHAALSARRRHSFDAWVSPLMDLFQTVGAPRLAA